MRKRTIGLPREVEVLKADSDDPPDLTQYSYIDAGGNIVTKKKGPLSKGPRPGATKKGKGGTRNQPKKGGVTY